LLAALAAATALVLTVLQLLPRMLAQSPSNS